ncbi:hypothetical protein [Azospirillum argentinense]|uniref:CorA-like Mg2+ transporter protein n=1 Tax=Azospirillum brasilense TaxID=192 RepID=A0A4D8Q0V7_AZOBR|nr:hypothetical protein [Azospirillum argentinense]QCO03448.1 hypothetical protein D3867_15365 [Azospirillum argentinense]
MDALGNDRCIEQHLCSLLLPLEFSPRFGTAVQDGIVAPLLSARVADLRVLTGRKPKDVPGPALWVESRFSAHADLTPAVRAVLCGADGPMIVTGLEGQTFRGMPPLRLSDAALALLNPKPSAPMLEIRLPDGVDGESHVPVWIRAGWLHLFGTGIGLLRFDFCTPEPAPTVRRLKACLCELSREAADGRGRLRFRKAEETTAAFSFDELLTTLTTGLVARGGAAVNAPLVRSEQHRSFLFSAVRFAEPLPNDAVRQQIGYALSRGTSPADDPSDEELDILIEMRRGRHHVAGPGGGAILLEPVTGSQDVEDFFTDRLVKLYIPLTALAYQEYLALLRFASDSRIAADYDAPTPEACRRLRDRNSAILDFRLNYRFSHVSTLHRVNRIYAEWRKALCLDGMLTELTTDVAEVADFLAQRREELEALRRAKVARMQTILGVAYGTLALLAGVYGMNFSVFGVGQTDTLLFWLPVLMAFLICTGILLWSYCALTPKCLDDPDPETWCTRTRKAIIMNVLVGWKRISPKLKGYLVRIQNAVPALRS